MSSTHHSPTQAERAPWNIKSLGEQPLEARSGTYYTIVVPFTLMRYGVSGSLFKQLNNYAGKPTSYGRELFDLLRRLPGVHPAITVDAPTTLYVEVWDQDRDGTPFDQSEAYHKITDLVNAVTA